MPSERVLRDIERLLDAASDALANSEWQSAFESAEVALGLDPDNADARSYVEAARRGLNAQVAESSQVEGQSPSPAPSPISGEGWGAGAVASLPSSFANGRYKVKSLLGEGGKKKVYLAHDTTLDRDVAFGLIKAEGLDADSRQRITREAQAMARLGDHPNLMPIFDLGDENGQPFMVQPLMVGGDVEALIARTEDGSLDLEDALRISIEICRGLEFAHGKGIIHRDLKPGNVWLTNEGTVRIGDFGLALSLDRSRLTQEKVMVGTVSYMPPEQATGGEVTERADLYSLGAMLYEMVTGRPPFMGDDDIAIIGQHINTPPVAPGWHNQSLPQTLDSLIMRLLSKDPAGRPESAAELLQALDAIDLAETATAHDEEQGSLDSMSGGVFVGRHREMDQLKATFEETLGGHGKMAALVGEPGIGKTRTAQELATYASMRGGQVLWGRSYEGGGAPPYYPWVQAIRSYVTDKDAETVRREMGSTASVIAEIVQDVKERLPDLQPPTPIDDPESARFRLFDSIATFLKTASTAQPIVLMLEDLHWSDKPSLLLLEFVARELTNSRLMIVGNYRDMELNRRHPLSVTLGELSRERLFDRVLLRGLQKHDVRRFIEVAAGIDPPNPLVDAVFTQTEGNPLFVTETVRLLIQEGDIASGAETEGGTSSWEIRIPEGVREVIGRRLDRLSERCNEVLTTAAVIGRQFRFDVLLALADEISESMLLDVLDEALDARIVEEVPSEVGLYQFAHALMQETLTGELSANRIVRLHARIAEALEEFYGDDSDSNAAELARHFSEAEVVLGPARLTHYSLIAGSNALALLAFDQAVTHFATALESAGGAVTDETSAMAMWGLGRAQSATLPRARRNEAVRSLRSAVDFFLANDQFDQAIEVADTEIVPIATGSGDPTEMASVIGPVLSHTKDQESKSRLLGRYADALIIEEGDFESALSSAKEALSLAEAQGSPALRATAMRSLGNVYFNGARWDDLAEIQPRAVDLARLSDSQVNIIKGSNHQVILEMRSGSAESAIGATSSFLEGARELKDMNHVEQALGMAIYAANLAGDWETSRTYLSELVHVAPDGSWGFGGQAYMDAMTGDADGFLDVIKTSAPASFFVLGQMAAIGVDLFGEGGLEPWILESSVKLCREAIADDSISNIYKEAALLSLAYSAPMRADHDECAELLECIRPQGRHMAFFAGAHIGRIRGRLMHHLNKLDEAYEEYSETETLLRHAGFRPEFVALCRDFAGLLSDRDAPGDREKATDLQDEAIAIATELGMKPLLERVLAQRDTLTA